jgi:hypothetical protein
MEDRCDWCGSEGEEIGKTWCGKVVKCTACHHEWEEV